jgi:enoyl-CoA hydratase
MTRGNAKIGLNEVALGIGLPSIVIETLRAQVPSASLVPIALEGGLFMPEQALSLGLVHEVVDADRLHALAMARAKEMAALPPHAFAQVKTAVRRPALAEIDLHDAAETERWLDTWFTPAAQERLRAAVARIRK